MSYMAALAVSAQALTRESESLRVEVARLRRAIKNAPHSPDCEDAFGLIRMDSECLQNCWQQDALKGGSK